MKTLIRMADKGLVPDPVIRMGIRLLDYKRLLLEKRGGIERQMERKQALIKEMGQSPVAVETHAANEQHYALPPEFFQMVLGKHLKYSGCYWPRGIAHLDAAEAHALSMIGRRARIQDGMRILELGCGWGSFTLWAARNYPRSMITAVSNSGQQREFIEARCRECGLENVRVLTADMNRFQIDERFDRVVSVEMFEHMRNWAILLNRIAGWLNSGGKMFLHIFTHKTYAYLYETSGADDWMGRYFFTGGIMPSDDLILYFQDDLKVERHWRISGAHYRKTAEAWLKNMNEKRTRILPVLAGVYGEDQAAIWFQRWRIFFMACAELWGYKNGQEWLVSHYLLNRRG